MEHPPWTACSGGAQGLVPPGSRLLRLAKAARDRKGQSVKYSMTNSLEHFGNMNRTQRVFSLERRKSSFSNSEVRMKTCPDKLKKGEHCERPVE